MDSSLGSRLSVYLVLRLLLDAVKPPIVIVRQAAAVFFQRIGERRIGIFLPMLHQLLGVAAEVFLKPNVNARYLEPSFLNRYAARMIDEIYGAAIEQYLRIFSGECRRL